MFTRHHIRFPFLAVGLSPGKSPALLRQEKMRSAVIEELLHVEKDFAKHLKVILSLLWSSRPNFYACVFYLAVRGI